MTTDSNGKVVSVKQQWGYGTSTGANFTASDSSGLSAGPQDAGTGTVTLGPMKFLDGDKLSDVATYEPWDGIMPYYSSGLVYQTPRAPDTLWAHVVTDFGQYHNALSTGVSLGYVAAALVTAPYLVYAVGVTAVEGGSLLASSGQALGKWVLPRIAAQALQIASNSVELDAADAQITSIVMEHTVYAADGMGVEEGNMLATLVEDSAAAAGVQHIP